MGRRRWSASSLLYEIPLLEVTGEAIAPRPKRRWSNSSIQYGENFPLVRSTSSQSSVFSFQDLPALRHTLQPIISQQERHPVPLTKTLEPRCYTSKKHLPIMLEKFIEEPPPPSFPPKKEAKRADKKSPCKLGPPGAEIRPAPPADPKRKTNGKNYRRGKFPLMLYPSPQKPSLSGQELPSLRTTLRPPPLPKNKKDLPGRVLQLIKPSPQSPSLERQQSGNQARKKTKHGRSGSAYAYRSPYVPAANKMFSEARQSIRSKHKKAPLRFKKPWQD